MQSMPCKARRDHDVWYGAPLRSSLEHPAEHATHTAGRTAVSAAGRNTSVAAAGLSSDISEAGRRGSGDTTALAANRAMNDDPASESGACASFARHVWSRALNNEVDVIELRTFV